ncbi:Sensor histidine kinase YycG [Jeotgalibaca dankookensis]|uniref:histidine kinase n=1 Tax=Jeotgalibaca dankookensis TaxID=708126 RepID=A0A1S6IR60_9LACT|nr:cell wall metabolism sensor histidine kinase WalK [Jeotgalibaca dankookensis]AQS54037.1 Sensor histidine kinase YycG [Jeotgalibaca dankookensis]
MIKKIKWRNSIHFKIPMLFIFLLLVSLQIIGAYFIRQLESDLISNFDSQMSLNVRFLENSVTPVLESENQEEINLATQNVLRDYIGGDFLEVQVIDAKGYIVGINDQTRQSMVGTKSTDRDVQQSLLLESDRKYQYLDEERNSRVLKTVSSIFSPTNPDEIIGAVMMESNIEVVYTQISEVVQILVSASAVAVVITIFLAIIISQGVARPIAEMRTQTLAIAQGNYSGKIRIYGNDEMGQLAETINDLALKVKDAQETTEAERQRLDSVLKHMSDGVIATDRRGRVMIINNRAVELLGINQEDAVGKSIMKVLNLDKTFTFRHLLEKDDELILHVENEDDKEDSTLQGEFSIIQRETGFISGVVCVLTDITEQEKIEQERRNFVSNVSHELRTPLTSVKSYTESLQEGAWKNPEIAPSFLKVIATETERMIRMVSDLLHLSRMDQGNMELEKEYISINDLLSHILDRFDMMVQSGALRDKNYQIVRDFTKRTLWVDVDQDKITQVIDNIMNNALKYSPEGGTITCRLMETHNSVVMSITDEGMGIPRKDLSHIFERFYRVDRARARSMGGTGLGLAISKEVLLLHGGRIWATSLENKGSTFFISLPYVSFEEEEWS